MGNDPGNKSGDNFFVSNCSTQGFLVGKEQKPLKLMQMKMG
jgi:hypothetical protein